VAEEETAKVETIESPNSHVQNLKTSLKLNLTLARIKTTLKYTGWLKYTAAIYIV
jgi:hypothetical protein